MRDLDVVIIGSGPSGCAAAIYCVQQGLHTLLIAGKKTSEVIPDKVQPSESIHPGVASILAQMGAAHCIDAASQGVYEGIVVNGQYTPLGADEQGAWRGHHINRPIFDAELLKVAVANGVTIRDDTIIGIETTDGRVTGITTKAGKQINCRYIIDASGQKRIAGKQLKFKELFCAPPLVTWTGVSECIPADHYLFEKPRTYFISHTNGWTWLAPEKNGRCTWTRMELKGKQQFLPPDELKDYPLASKTKTANRRWSVYRPICKEGVLLCGDAAGIIDPAAGQGILNALITATMAAKTVKACIDNPTFEALYLARYDDWFINDYMNKVERLKGFYGENGIRMFV